MDVQVPAGVIPSIYDLFLYFFVDFCNIYLFTYFIY